MIPKVSELRRVTDKTSDKVGTTKQQRYCCSESLYTRDLISIHYVSHCDRDVQVDAL